MKSLFYIMLIVLGALVDTVRCQAQEISATKKSYDSKIAFMSLRDGNEEIFIINPDGTQLTRLTDHAAKDRYPTWSPDGRSIAFVSDRSGEDQIYLMDPDGSNIQKLSDTPGKKSSLSWAPDGSRIAFAMLTKKGRHIHMLDRSNGKITQLCRGDSPAWSPDGSRILLISGNLAALGVINIGGSKVKPFIQGDHPPFNGAFCGSPRWSPDGKFVAFAQASPEKTASRVGTQMELYIVSHDGKEPRRLTDTEGATAPFGFSPDGNSIVIGYADSEKKLALFILNIDGSGRRRLTKSKKHNWSASWSPQLSTRE